MTAVANSSVLIALSSLDQLDLLRGRFPDGIWVPTAVWREVVELGQSRPGAKVVAATPWITVQAVQDEPLLSLLRADLDDGESEAIALCREAGAAAVLLDEKSARRAARRLGLVVIGTVGILIWAKQTGHISSLAAELDTLQSRGRFRLGRSVYEAALSTVGETVP